MVTKRREINPWMMVTIALAILITFEIGMLVFGNGFEKGMDYGRYETRLLIEKTGTIPINYENNNTEVNKNIEWVPIQYFCSR